MILEDGEAISIDHNLVQNHMWTEVCEFHEMAISRHESSVEQIVEKKKIKQSRSRKVSHKLG